MHAQRLGESGAFGGGATKPSAGVGGDTANEKPAVKFKSAKGAVDAFVAALRAGDESRLEAILSRRMDRNQSANVGVCTHGRSSAASHLPERD